MNVKTTLKVLLSLTLLFTVGCAEGFVESDTKLPSGITMELTLPSPAAVRTYAADDDRENEINRLDVFIFDSNGKVINDVGRQTIRSFAQAGSSITANIAMNRGVKKQQFYVIANATDAILDGIGTKSQLDALVISTTIMPVHMFVMSGNTELQDISELSSKISLSLTRCVARFDVNLQGDVTNFKIKSARVLNARSHSYVFQKKDENGVIQIPVSAKMLQYKTVEMTSLQSRGFTSCLYAYENYNDEPKLNENTTSIMLGGEYANSGITTYYRIDIKDKDDVLQILRNNRYDITITKVEGPGFVDEDDAEMGSNANLRYSIEVWKQNDMNTEFDGTLSLSVSERQISIPRDAFGGTIHVTTNADAWGLTSPVDKSDLPATWLTVKQDGDMCNYLAPTNNTGVARTAYFYVTSGSRLKIKMEVTQAFGEATIIKLSSTSVSAPFSGTGAVPVFTELSLARNNVTWTIEKNFVFFGGDNSTDWVKFVDGQPMEATSTNMNEKWQIKVNVLPMPSVTIPSRSAVVRIKAVDNNSGISEYYKFTIVQLNSENVKLTTNRHYVAVMGSEALFEIDVLSNWKWTATLLSGDIGSTKPQDSSNPIFSFTDEYGDYLDIPKETNQNYLSYTATGNNKLYIKVQSIDANTIRNGYLMLKADGNVATHYVRLHQGDYKRVSVNGLDILDRNLGAINPGPAQRGAISKDTMIPIAGYHYQWGRCPDGYEVLTANCVTGVSSSVWYVNKMPTYGDKGSRSWISGNGYSWFVPSSDTPIDQRDFGRMWDANGVITVDARDIKNTNQIGVRTLFDPCPEGYRVPTAKELQQLFLSTTSEDHPNYRPISEMQSNYFGRWIQESVADNPQDVFFPAGGAMSQNTVTSSLIKFNYPAENENSAGDTSLGTEGYYMSSSLAGDNSRSHYFFFNATKKEMRNSRHPHTTASFIPGGMSVRCVANSNQ